MKKGFTLVELLAVLVILSIISLISFLIVGNTINTSKNKLSEIQIDNIIDAAKVYYLKEGLEEENIENSITETCVNLKYLIDNDYIDNVEIKDLATKENIVGSVKIKYSNNKYKYEFVEYECSACKLVDGEPNKEGSKYSCEVKEGTSYNFYVLTTPEEGAETIELIMDRNICEDGTPTDASKENKCLVAWQTSGANADGPVTAMDYLYKATKDWTNIPNIEMNYTDEGNTGDYGYGTIVTTDNITKITKKDGTAVTVLINQEGYSNLKARLPYKSEVANSNGSNNYLYENLDGSEWLGSGTQPTNNISGIYGYWTLSSYDNFSNAAWFVRYYGYLGGDGVDYVSDNGVRAVITVKL